MGDKKEEASKAVTLDLDSILSLMSATANDVLAAESDSDDDDDDESDEGEGEGNKANGKGKDKDEDMASVAESLLAASQSHIIPDQEYLLQVRLTC